MVVHILIVSQVLQQMKNKTHVPVASYSLHYAVAHLKKSLAGPVHAEHIALDNVEITPIELAWIPGDQNEIRQLLQGLRGNILDIEGLDEDLIDLELTSEAVQMRNWALAARLYSFDKPNICDEVNKALSR